MRGYEFRSQGLVLQARSASAHNLAERGVGTLLMVEPDAIVYVKSRVVDGPLEVAGADALGYFLLAVEDVLEDAAADWEAGMRVTGAITYAPRPSLDSAWARATLAALASPRARACRYFVFGDSFGPSFGASLSRGASSRSRASRSL